VLSLELQTKETGYVILFLEKKSNILSNNTFFFFFIIFRFLILSLPVCYIFKNIIDNLMTQIKSKKTEKFIISEGKSFTGFNCQ